MIAISLMILITVMVGMIVVVINIHRRHPDIVVSRPKPSRERGQSKKADYTLG